VLVLLKVQKKNIAKIKKIKQYTKIINFLMISKEAKVKTTIKVTQIQTEM
jgi:hypothetical protein